MQTSLYLLNLSINNHKQFFCLITMGFCFYDLLFYIHGKQLRSCWDGQLLNNTVPGGSLPVFSIHSFSSNCQLALLKSAEEGKFSMKECAGRKGRCRVCLHMKWTRYQPIYHTQCISQCCLVVAGSSVVIFMVLQQPGHVAR